MYWKVEVRKLLRYFFAYVARGSVVSAWVSEKRKTSCDTVVASINPRFKPDINYV